MRSTTRLAVAGVALALSAVVAAPVAHANAQCTNDVSSQAPTPWSFSQLVNTVAWWGQLQLTGNNSSGWATSTTVSTDVAGRVDTLLSRIDARWSVSYAAGDCNGANVTFQYSVDDGATWRRLGSSNPGRPSGGIDIDLLTPQISGRALRWKAFLYRNIPWCWWWCQPPCSVTVTSFNIHYEALNHGEYQQNEPIPLANVMYKGTYETPGASWGPTQTLDPRGHVEVFEIYNPDNLNAPINISSTPKWDAGQVLAATGADSRTVFWNDSGTLRPFDINQGSNLEDKVVSPLVPGWWWNPPTGDCSMRSPVDGRLLFDFTGDGVCNSADSRAVIQWVRGWETPSRQKPWKLGAVLHGNVAVLTPPGQPAWLSGKATPTGETTLFNNFMKAQATRPTRVLAPALDGMLHAFDGGSFRSGDDPTTPQTEFHGYFVRANKNAPRNYGTGREIWAVIPRTLLGSFKWNHPPAATPSIDADQKARLDSAVALADIAWPSLQNGAATEFRTLAVAGFGPEANQAPGNPTNFLTGIDATDANNPRAMWANDWSDGEYHGNVGGVAIGPINEAGSRRWVAVTTSGLVTPSVDPNQPTTTAINLFLIDAVLGQTLPWIGKVRVDPWWGGARATRGMAGSPALVDANNDGEYDRVYFATSAGDIYKYDTPTRQLCRIGRTPNAETVFAPIAVDVIRNGTAPQVAVWVGISPDPEAITFNSPTGFYSFIDNDTYQACTVDAAQVNFHAINGLHIWAAPVIDASGVVFAAATNANRLDPCAAGSTQIVSIGRGNAVPQFATLPAGTLAVGGLRLYDGAIFVNAPNARTTIQGKPIWNSPPVGGVAPGTGGGGNGKTLPVRMWMER